MKYRTLSSWIIISIFIFLFSGCTKKSPPVVSQYPDSVALEENALVVLIIQHSMRIPDNRITVQIIPNRDSYLVKADSQPMKGYPKWKHTESHNEKNISKEEYAQIQELLEQINWIRLKNEPAVGIDGEVWTLTFVKNDETLEASLWCPYHEPNQDYKVFIEAVKTIVAQTEFNYKELVSP